MSFSSKLKVKNFRWYVVVFIAMATAINYMDRQTFPVAVNKIKETISISDSQYGMINSLFLFSYGTMYAIGGWLLDILGSRKGYAIVMLWWSLADILQGTVSSVLGLGVTRFLLGIGEGGGFPASAKVVSEWFPVNEKSFAFGIFNTGSSVGAIAAPPLIAVIIASLNWRWVFFLTGSVGVLWVIVWFMIYSLPSQSKFITSGGKEYITPSLQEGSVNHFGKSKIPWISLFKYRQIWGLLTIKFLTDAAWFFFIFWLPKYLSDVRGLNILQIGLYAWIPYACAGGGSFIGGWLSSYLIKKKVSLDTSRKICLGLSAAMLPASLFITNASFGVSLVLFSVAMFGHQFWSTIVQTLAADMFPSRIVGSVSGLMGCLGTYGAMLFSIIIGYVIQKFGYSPALVISGILHPISFLLFLIIVRKIGFIKMNSHMVDPSAKIMNQ